MLQHKVLGAAAFAGGAGVGLGLVATVTRNTVQQNW